MRKAHRKDLIRPDRPVLSIAVDNIKQTSGRRVPELLVEASLRRFRHYAVSARAFIVAERARDILYDFERVIPKRLYLDRLPVARRYNIVSDFGVHPR